MPSGYVPGVPKSVRPVEWGTARYETSATSGGASITLSDPGARGFWVVTSATYNNDFVYKVGADQQITNLVEEAIQAHNGSGGWTTQRIDVARRVLGQTWDTTLSMNVGGVTRSSVGGLFQRIDGMRGQPYGGFYAQLGAAPYTVTPPVNRHRYPGGICVFGYSQDVGYVGPTGISAASQNLGWKQVAMVQAPTGYWSMLAYYILSTDRVETAPPVSVSHTQAPDCVILATAYIR